MGKPIDKIKIEDHEFNQMIIEKATYSIMYLTKESIF
jgi:hypothetical protein